MPVYSSNFSLNSDYTKAFDDAENSAIGNTRDAEKKSIDFMSIWKEPWIFLHLFSFLRANFSHNNIYSHSNEKNLFFKLISSNMFPFISQLLRFTRRRVKNATNSTQNYAGHIFCIYSHISETSTIYASYPDTTDSYLDAYKSSAHFEFNFEYPITY